jgi:hypothetical protein
MAGVSIPRCSDFFSKLIVDKMTTNHAACNQTLAAAESAHMILDEIARWIGVVSPLAFGLLSASVALLKWWRASLSTRMLRELEKEHRLIERELTRKKFEALESTTQHLWMASRTAPGRIAFDESIAIERGTIFKLGERLQKIDSVIEDVANTANPLVTGTGDPSQVRG